MRALALAISFTGLFLAACKPASEPTKTEGAGSTPPAPTSSSAVRVRMKTSMGDIVLELDRAKAPATVENFKSYVEKGHYNGTVFHRVIGSFMIQGGGFAIDGGKLVEKPSGAPIANEGTNGLKNVRGSIAMARTADPNSARAQFFINVVDNPALDYPSNGGYAVFGKVVEGMETVDKIKAVPTGQSTITMLRPDTGEAINAPAGDVPVTPVVIESAVVETAGS